MKPCSPELRALLTKREFYVADLYTFSGGNLGSIPLRYTSGDQDIMANGLTYSSGGQTGPYFDRKGQKAKMHWKVGVDVDTMALDIIPGSATIFGQAFQTAVRNGLFDGATVLLERAYMATYGDTSLGVLYYFLGRVAAIDSGRSLITFNVASHLELLNLQLPRNLFQASCKNTLGDHACAINLNNSPYNTSTATVGSGSTASIINVSGLTNNQPEGTYDQGKIKFTTGAYNGLSASIRSFDNTGTLVMNLLGYLPGPPGVGDAFVLTWGCDKSLGPQGCPKFSNVARYRAEPKVPLPITVA